MIYSLYTPDSKKSVGCHKIHNKLLYQEYRTYILIYEFTQLFDRLACLHHYLLLLWFCIAQAAISALEKFRTGFPFYEYTILTQDN